MLNRHSLKEAREKGELHRLEIRVKEFNNELAKNNNQINRYSKRLAMAIYLWVIENSISSKGYFISEKYFDKYSANSRKYYCPECVNSDIRWRVFLMEVLEKCIQNQNLIDFAKTGYEWARYVRSNFGHIARDCKPFLAENLAEDVDFSDFDGNSFRPSEAIGFLT